MCWAAPEDVGERAAEAVLRQHDAAEVAPEVARVALERPALTARPQYVAGQSPNGAGPPAAAGRNAGTNAKFVCGAPPRPLCTQWPAVHTTLRFVLSTSVAEHTQSLPSGRFEKSRPIVRVPGRSVVTGFALGLRLRPVPPAALLRFWRR